MPGKEAQPSRRFEEHLSGSAQARDVVYLFLEAFNNGDMAGLAAAYAPYVVDHTPGQGQSAGLAGVQRSLGELRAAFPDLRLSVEEIVAEKDTVVARYTARGTHEGTFLDIPASGRKVAFSLTEMYHVVTGKIVEVWRFRNNLDITQQLRGLPPPAGSE